MKVRRVILVTDGDQYAAKAVQHVAKEIGGRCITQSKGNPTHLTGEQLVQLILKAPHDPVFVLFDDCGLQGEGPGEAALKYVATHEQIIVLGAIAVASNSHKEWTKIDISIDRYGELTPYGVDKYGVPDIEEGRVSGDTVYCLDQLQIPIVVGIGDIGKMNRKDGIEHGAPITMQAAQLILERSGFYGTKKSTRSNTNLPKFSRK